jgi:dissimilatory sulfite reductase (desulfoviridin) alpha/beta subunit
MARVENHAKQRELTVIPPGERKTRKTACRSNLTCEVKGYQLDTCLGQDGCPNRANISGPLIGKLEELFKEENLLAFLKARVRGDLKTHNEFKVTIAECPNACSQPQIKDIGIIGACLPQFTDEECSLCNACVDVCREKALVITDNAIDRPILDHSLCLQCGQCGGVCPTGVIKKGLTGFRVLLGGKLGRHPRLAKELSGIYNEENVIEIVKACIRFYKEHNRQGERFAENFMEVNFETEVSSFVTIQQNITKAGKQNIPPAKQPK